LKRLFSKKTGAQFSVAAIVVFLVFFLQFVINSATLDRVDGIAYDAKLILAPPIPNSLANIQIVDIDERSLFELERMPWRRDLYAQLTNKLTNLGAIVVAFDILFTEPQLNPASAVVNDVAFDSKEIITDSELQRILSKFDYDAVFANAMVNNEVVLGTLLHHQTDLNKGVIFEDSVVQSDSPLFDNVVRFDGFAGITDKLSTNATGMGFINSFEDADGFVRRAALVAKLNDTFLPSLAAETFRVYSLADKLEPIWQSQGQNRFLEGIKIGLANIPTDNEGRVLIPFKGPARTYPYTSATDVLNDRVDPNRFDQAVVFVGTSATGLADLRVTPVNVNYPGVEIHATVFEALLAPERLIYRPDWWQGALAIQLVLIALFVTLVFPHLEPLAMSTTALLVVLIVLASNMALWHYQSIDLPLVSALLLTLILAVYYIGSGFFSESNRRKQVKAIFDQYVPPAHIDQLLEDKSSLSLDGERRELSVMFSDIRSFTSISEAMTAQELKRWLNEFFSPITRVIFENDGTIDKYVGDMVMAFWGAPLTDVQHANKSIKAAMHMLEALEELNEHFAAKDLPLANIGIGINTGDMNVGDMGSDYRRSYTVIGDAVNLGSRLEGLTKFYGLTLLVSEFTRDQATDYAFLLVDKVKVKGKDQPVTIYTPLPPDIEQSMAEIDHQYTQAIRHYFDRKFSEALPIFESIKPEFRHPILAQLYVKRCQHFIEKPPSSDWDGSFIHTSK
jgi:adenylate cyclase